MRRNVTRAVELAALGKIRVTQGRCGRDRDNAGQLKVVERLLRLHGLPQKIGQILSLSELDKDSPVFTRLVETSAQFPASEIFTEIDRALGRPCQDCFLSLNPNAIAASLSQVHPRPFHHAPVFTL